MEAGNVEKPQKIAGGQIDAQQEFEGDQATVETEEVIRFCILKGALDWSFYFHKIYIEIYTTELTTQSVLFLYFGVDSCLIRAVDKKSNIFDLILSLDFETSISFNLALKPLQQIDNDFPVAVLVNWFV